MDDFMAMLKLSFKPKLIKGATFTLPTIEQLVHEDEALVVASVL